MTRLVQVVLPPTPAPPAADPTFVIDRVSEMVMMTLVLVGVVVIAVKVFGPIARAWARKLEGKTGDPQILADLDQIREQLGEVDSLRARVAELEDRIEFTERLLAQRKDQDLLPRGRSSG
jgi:hypothetical protein